MIYVYHDLNDRLPQSTWSFTMVNMIVRFEVFNDHLHWTTRSLPWLRSFFMINMIIFHDQHDRLPWLTRSFKIEVFFFIVKKEHTIVYDDLNDQQIIRLVVHDRLKEDYLNGGVADLSIVDQGIFGISHCRLMGFFRLQNFSIQCKYFTNLLYLKKSLQKIVNIIQSIYNEYNLVYLQKNFRLRI